MKNRFPGLRMAGMEAIYWAFVSASMSYMTALFTSEGVRAALVGLVAVAATGGAFVGQFVMGNFSDRRQTIKKIYLIGIVLTIPLCFLICRLENFWVRISLVAVMGFFQTPCAALMDTWVMLRIDDPDRQYGPIRAGGSVGYAVFSMLYGSLLAKYGFGITPWITTGLAVLLIPLTLTVPDAVPEKKYRKEKGDSFFRDIHRILKKKSLPCVYAALFFIGVGSCSLWNVLPILLERVGGDVSSQGLIILLATLAEGIIVVSSRYVYRLPSAYLLALAALLGILLNVGIGLSAAIMPLVFSCLLRGINGAFALLGYRRLLLQMAPSGLSSTSQTFGDAAYTCLGSMLGGLLCGLLLDYMGVGSMALCCGSSELIALLLLIPVLRKLKTKEKAEL